MAFGTLYAAQRPCKLLLHIISFYQATYDLSTAGAATQQPSPTSFLTVFENCQKEIEGKKATY